MNQKNTYSVLAFRYGITNGFSTLLTIIATTYWSIFLTGAVGLETAAMAVIMSASSFVDLISIPICGIILQKTRIKGGKYGIFRPWLLIGGVLAALFRWLSFTDLGLTGIGSAIWFGGTYILAYVAFNMAFSAFSGILPLMAKTPGERVAFASARTTCNSIGKFIFSLTSVTLISVFGQGNDARGYCALAGLIAVVVIFGFAQLYVASKNYDIVDTTLSSGNGKKDEYSVSIWEMIKFTISKPFLLFLLGSVCKGSIFFIITGLAPYFYSYVVGDKSMLTWYMSASTFLMIGGSFLTPYANKLFRSTRNTFAAGIAIYGLCLILAYFLGTTAVNFTVFLSIGYVGYAIAHASEIALYSAVVDYTQWKHDRNLKPFMMTLFSLTPKIGTVVGTAVMGFGLVAIGFDQANVTAQAADGIRILLSGLPAALAVLSVLAMSLFPLTDKRIQEMQDDLAQRKAASTK